MTTDKAEVQQELEKELDEFGAKFKELMIEYRMEKVQIIEGVLSFSKTVGDAVGTVSISWEAPKDKEE